MYISCVYLSTYSINNPIKGHFEIKSEGLQTKIDFSEEEAAAIQDLCSKALARTQASIAAEILNASVAVPALEAPKSTIEDADFEEVSF